MISPYAFIMDMGSTQTKTKQIIISMTIVLFILAIIIALFISRLISKPLSKLTNAVDEVSRGNFKVEVEKQGKIDEVNTLAASLSRVMATMKLAIMEEKEKKKPNK